ncbi:MAG: calcium-binding protein, partial [Caldilinea sp.]
MHRKRQQVTGIDGHPQGRRRRRPLWGHHHKRHRGVQGKVDRLRAGPVEKLERLRRPDRRRFPRWNRQLQPGRVCPGRRHDRQHILPQRIKIAGQQRPLVARDRRTHIIGCIRRVAVGAVVNVPKNRQLFAPVTVQIARRQRPIRVDAAQGHFKRKAAASTQPAVEQTGGTLVDRHVSQQKNLGHPPSRRIRQKDSTRRRQMGGQPKVVEGVDRPVAQHHQRGQRRRRGAHRHQLRLRSVHSDIANGHPAPRPFFAGNVPKFNQRVVGSPPIDAQPPPLGLLTRQRQLIPPVPVQITSRQIDRPRIQLHLGQHLPEAAIVGGRWLRQNLDARSLRPVGQRIDHHHLTRQQVAVKFPRRDFARLPPQLRAVEPIPVEPPDLLPWHNLPSTDHRVVQNQRPPLGDGNDLINGLDGDDILIGGAGNDIEDGGSGNDTAVLAGNLAAFTISFDSAAGYYTITGVST